MLTHHNRLGPIFEDCDSPDNGCLHAGVISDRLCIRMQASLGAPFMNSRSPVSNSIAQIAAHISAVRPALVFFVVLIGSTFSAAQDSRSLYAQIKAFSLTGGRADVNNLVLKRDRVEMTFTGTF